MKTNPMKEVQKYGQSLWLDNIRRTLITSGELKNLIADGLMGVTSNPAIFEKAIAESEDYDEQMRQLLAEGKEPSEILDALTLTDIQMAADLFRPVYDKTKGQDGFVSIELDPALARRIEETVRAAKELHRRLDRKNVMIKVPATEEGIRAIEVLIAEGISINVTLIFSIECYTRVAKAYIAGIKRWVQNGGSSGEVRSVASVFISRVDTVVDQRLKEPVQAVRSLSGQTALKALLGKAGIANAVLIYQNFKELFHSGEFRELQKQGAHVQRPLWASTGTKNPDYPDVLYVEALIGPETVNTVPPATLAAFRDHGKVKSSLDEDPEGARETVRRLAGLGIDLYPITQQLQTEGVKAFEESFRKLTAYLNAKRSIILAGKEELFVSSPGRYEKPVKERLRLLQKEKFSGKLWARDSSLWSPDPEIQRKIRNRLGWLTVTDGMSGQVGEVMAFAQSIKDAGFTHVVLLGMGGSSLCPEVCRKTYGVAKDFPNLTVLDTTDPASILRVEKQVDIRQTLWILASKSGTTMEVQSLYLYFSEKIRVVRGDRFGEHFMAITDPGTSLEHLAREQKFRKVFLNPPDIGGRYSALSYFGLVPAALIGVDLERFLDRAEAMVQSTAPCINAEDNTALRLGVILGMLGKEGRDKVTLITTPAIGSFGVWAEQLIAESTGKEGKGLVPVEGERIGDPRVYGDDRLFVYLTVDSAPDKEMDSAVLALEQAGQPVVRIRLRDPVDLAGEFFRWEMATAVAGTILGINPFDEPNVTESKENTRKVLEEFQKTGRLPLREPILTHNGIQIYFNTQARYKGLPGDLLRFFLEQAKRSHYVAIMAYLEGSEVHEVLLQKFRITLRDQYRLATTLGYGPRFLHSTGQLHKGGPHTGLFIQITAEDSEDIPIPGKPYGFSLLKRAQALGDYLSLTDHGRPVLEIRLGSNPEVDLKKLQDWLKPQDMETG
ncbi:MAG: bifunctional transaldolase/phosoglucose isomerase [Nitrospiria bacterium]